MEIERKSRRARLQDQSPVAFRVAPRQDYHAAGAHTLIGDPRCSSASLALDRIRAYEATVDDGYPLS